MCAFFPHFFVHPKMPIGWPCISVWTTLGVGKHREFIFSTNCFLSVEGFLPALFGDSIDFVHFLLGFKTVVSFSVFPSEKNGSDKIPDNLAHCLFHRQRDTDALFSAYCI